MKHVPQSCKILRQNEYSWPKCSLSCNKKTACDYFNGKHHSGISLWQQQISPDYASGKLKNCFLFRGDLAWHQSSGKDINKERKSRANAINVIKLAVVSVHILQLAFNKRVTHHMNSFTLVLNLFAQGEGRGVKRLVMLFVSLRGANHRFRTHLGWIATIFRQQSIY